MCRLEKEDGEREADRVGSGLRGSLAELGAGTQQQLGVARPLSPRMSSPFLPGTQQQQL